MLLVGECMCTIGKLFLYEYVYMWLSITIARGHWLKHAIGKYCQVCFNLKKLITLSLFISWSHFEADGNYEKF